MINKSSGNSLIVPLVAVCMLSALSVVDWGELSDGRLSNFNLIEDIIDGSILDVVETAPVENLLDPALEAAMAEVTSEKELPVHEVDIPVVINDSITETPPVESPVEETYYPERVIEVAQSVGRVDGVQPIEDYTPDQSGLFRLKAALSQRDSRRVRIAVIGDSYIEGDIFTQDVRRLLQQEYGGHGVGYMSMHSDFPGFRRSVTQSDNGWTVRDMRNHSSDPVRPLSGEYCIGNVGSVTTFKGPKYDNVRNWNSSKLLFIADSDGLITVKTDSLTKEIPVYADSRVQLLAVDEVTTKTTFNIQANNVKILGAWLEDNSGVGVDCMSLRGNSGASHKSVSTELSAQMAQHIPYDLIIVEYGLNALSAEQSNYQLYTKLMTQVVRRIRECYPSADIMMLGVGDRGRKKGTTVSSIPTVEAMIAAQRQCAADCGILFWDTRAAMGGEDAIIDWRRRGLVNADYIHLNHKGGSELANEFVNSLKQMINGSN